MNMFLRKLLGQAAPLALASLLMTGVAGADEAGGSNREAAKHFQRAVTLYGEADYRAALVEFRRAYELAPNAAVLYNIGETQFQLQDYAAALTAFENYVATAAGADPHRGEVEHSIDVLRARVGRLTITTSPVGADVTIDDQAVGTSPFAKPILVSIGHRKITVSMAGRPQTTRYVDVAADDNEAILVPLSDPVAAPGSDAVRFQLDAPPVAHKSAGPALRITGWVGTVLLAAGAGGSGIVALLAAKDLAHAKDAYPTSAATLTSDANRVHTFGILADALTAGAVVLGGVTLYSTVASKSGSQSDSALRPEVTLTPRGIRAGISF